MSNAKAFAIVCLAAALGMAIGLAFAGWRFGGPHFIDREILLAARILIGGFGAIIFGYGARAMIFRRIIHNS